MKDLKAFGWLEVADLYAKLFVIIYLIQYQIYMRLISRVLTRFEKYCKCVRVSFPLVFLLQ